MNYPISLETHLSDAQRALEGAFTAMIEDPPTVALIGDRITRALTQVITARRELLGRP